MSCGRFLFEISAINYGICTIIVEKRVRYLINFPSVIPYLEGCQELIYQVISL